jgi:hypothetical protein
MVTKATEESWFRAGGARDFSLVQSIQNSEVHAACHAVGTGNSFLRELTQGMKLTIYLHLMLRLSMNDTILTLAICLNGMHRGSFTLTFITS